jgi:hypothetical protein
VLYFFCIGGFGADAALLLQLHENEVAPYASVSGSALCYSLL